MHDDSTPRRRPPLDPAAQYAAWRELWRLMLAKGPTLTESEPAEAETVEDDA